MPFASDAFEVTEEEVKAVLHFATQSLAKAAEHG